MSLTVLRKGRRWRMPFSTKMVDLFHVIARRHGSRAVWLPHMHCVMTDDPEESAKNLPYEEFISSAALRALEKKD